MNGVKAGIVREQARERNATGSLLTWQTTDQAVAPCPSESQEKVVALTVAPFPTPWKKGGVVRGTKV
jgi:hypothetical protein